MANYSWQHAASSVLLNSVNFSFSMEVKPNIIKYFYYDKTNLVMYERELIPSSGKMLDNFFQIFDKATM